MGQLKSWSASLFPRDTLKEDAVTGVVLGVESVPDGPASGILAGVNPIFGLHGLMVAGRYKSMNLSQTRDVPKPLRWITDDSCHLRFKASIVAAGEEELHARRGCIEMFDLMEA